MLDVAAVLPPPREPTALLTEWRLDPLTVLPLAGASLAYAAGVRRVRRGGGRFPRRRVTAFAAGIAVLVVALASPVDAYAEASFPVHMAQHLLLTLAAPPLLALGAPIALALRASTARTRRTYLVPALRSRPVAILARPVVGWALFVSVPFVVHLTPLFDAALRSSPIHALEHLLWLATALVYWWPIVGTDPIPRPPSYAGRLLSLAMAMPAQSFLALIIYNAASPLYPTYAALPPPWGASILDDQRSAAVMMWVLGNLAMVLAIVAVASGWRRDEDARQRREEEREDRAARLASSGA